MPLHTCTNLTIEKTIIYQWSTFIHPQSTQDGVFFELFSKLFYLVDSNEVGYDEE